MFCRVCRNPECRRSSAHKGKWIERMMTQVQRLLEDPTFTDANDPRFEHIQRQDFKDMLMDAVRLEIVDRKGDWEPPSAQDVLSMAHKVMTGSTPPPEPEKQDQPLPVEGLDEEELSSEPVVLWEVRVRGTSGYYKVALDQWEGAEPQWHCTCPAFKYRKDQRILCKHIISQQPLYAIRTQEVVEPPAPEAPTPAPRKPQVVGPEKLNFRPPMMNIPLPTQGVMVDGSTPPTTQAAPPTADPWATTPQETVVAVGARVTMGGNKKD